MEYTKLGRTGLDVSRICLGCMSYGGGNRGNHAWSLGEEESRPFIKRALEELSGMGHPDADPKLLGKQINVMLTPHPINKRKPKFHVPDPELQAEADEDVDDADEGDDEHGPDSTVFHKVLRGAGRNESVIGGATRSSRSSLPIVSFTRRRLYPAIPRMASSIRSASGCFPCPISASRTSSPSRS